MEARRLRIGSIAALLAMAMTLVGCATDEIPSENDGEEEAELAVDDSVELAAEVGESTTATLELGNTGDALLEIAVEPEPTDWLDVSERSLEVDPDETLDLEVLADCAETDETATYDGHLHLITNDPDREEKDVAVSLTCHGLDTGGLTVEIDGLDGLDADVAVTGPSDFSADLTATETFDELIPGDYTVEAAAVEEDPARYEPIEQLLEVTVESGETAIATVDYELVPGALSVEVIGLPDGMNHVIDVVGGGESISLPQSGQLDDLAPGDYTLEPSPVADYDASNVEVTIESGQTTDATVEYMLETGSLLVNVAGLDGGVDHDIDLVDDDGDATAVPQNGELWGLEPGDYTLEVHEVTEDLTTYAPHESNVTVGVTIVSDQTTEVHVVYEPVDAQWEIAVDGLPDATDADISVQGGDLDTTITDTTAFDDLIPDVYDITPSDVDGPDGLAVYEAPSTSVDVESGSNPPTEVNYQAITGSLNVIVSGLGGLDADIEIRDADDTPVAQLDGSQIVSDLEPGTYTIDPQPVDDGTTTYTAPVQTRDVLSNSSPDVEVQYQDVPGELTLSASGLPDEAELEATVSGPGGFSSSYTGEQTIEGLQTGSYTVEFHQVDSDDWTTWEPDPVEVNVDVESDTTPEASTTYTRIDAALDITASGLPGGAELEATVTYPDGTTADYTGDQSFDDIEPGEYIVDYLDVDIDEWTAYRADPVQVVVDVESGTTPQATTDYDLVEGGLSLNATGLPGNLELEAQITGPDGFDEDYTGAQTIGGLVPGEYTVIYGDVSDGTTTYEPDPVEVVVDVESDEAPSASTHYESVDGSLGVEASGLPGGMELKAQITGPSNYSTSISGEQTIDGLDPGEYTVSFDDVDDGDLTTWQPIPDQAVLDVESGHTAVASTTYEIVEGAIELDADGLGSLDLEASITGPDGYDEQFTGAQTVDSLIPGQYTVTFESVDDGSATYVADPNQVQLEIESGETAEANTQYEVVEGALEISVEFPGEIQPFTLEIVDESDAVVGSEEVTDGDVVVFDDLEAEDHTVEAAGSIYDQWDNEYLQLDGFGQTHAVESGAITETSLSGTLPTLVQTETDSGDYSLREVVGRVNEESVITFDDNVDVIGLSDEIAIDKGLILVGNDHRRPAIEATETNRLFWLTSEADEVIEPAIQSLTLTGGDAPGNGGAIDADSSLTLFDVLLEDNRADGRGGAIYAGDDLTLTDVDAVGNQAYGNGGGAIQVDETLIADRVTFVDNRIEDETSWGGAIYLASGSVAEIDRAIFDGNHAESQGGAIMALIGADSLQIDRSLFVDNTSDSSGGAIRASSGANELTTITNSTFYGNEAATRGGAIAARYSDTNVELLHVTIVDNQASTGPAIHWDGADDAGVSVAASLIADNGSDQSELTVDQSDDEEQISSGYDNVVTAVDETYFDATSFDETGTPADPIDAHIDRFGHNAGWPKTVSVTDDSPAEGLVFSYMCADVDQRGYQRPDDERCTAGAWEFDPNIETFDNLELGNSYEYGTFVGNDDIEWYYDDAKNAASSTGDNDIDGNGLILRGEDGRFGAEDIAGGVDAVQLQYTQAYSDEPPRQFEVLIDGDVVYTSPVFGTDDDDGDVVHTVEIEDLGVDGEFDLEVSHITPGTSAQITFDNIRWE